MAELPFHSWEIWAMESLRSGLKVTSKLVGEEDWVPWFAAIPPSVMPSFVKFCPNGHLKTY